MNEIEQAAALAAAWEKLPLSNDFMFCRVMSNLDVCREFIERLLHIKIERLAQPESQKAVNISADTRGVRFDVYVKDSSRVFDLEMQVANQGDLPFRARYYQGALDMDMLELGEPVTNLKESYIVFLCLFDPFKQRLPVYTVQKIFAEKQEVSYTDGTNTVFFNCRAYKDAGNEQVQNILSYLVNGTAKDGFTAQLERHVETARQNEIWRKEFMTLEMIKTARQNEIWRKEFMTLEMIKMQQQEIGFAKGLAIGEQRGRNEGIAIGEQRGIIIGTEQAARNMLADGFSVKQTARLTGLSEEQVRALAAAQ